ncbi:MAG: hypothetical protein IKF22_12045 [Lachnospiraceae bacterium]|nr:hypothetical protein [Lachnospiraceae bacterium]
MFRFTVLGNKKETYIDGVTLENAIARSKNALFSACTTCEHHAENIKISEHHDDGQYHVVAFTYTDAYTGEDGTCQIKIVREGHEYTPMPSLFPAITKMLDEMTL